jgi:hypothetical protein
MIQVKISSKGAGANADLSQFTGNKDGIVGNCQLHLNEDIKEADIWFVMEEPEVGDQNCSIPEGRLIYLGAEVCRPVGWAEEDIVTKIYLSQFDLVFTFLNRVDPSTRYALPFLPWMVNANHGPSITQPHLRDVNFFRELASLPKTKEISVFCSNQVATADHRMRLRFVQALDSHFNGRMDWFGNGFHSIPQKWDGLAPYKYTLVLENQSSNHVITEKIQDAYLALCFPVYWGAPDINEFFPTESLMEIDAKDLKGSIDKIEQLLDIDPYRDKLASLLEAKRRVTDDYNFVVRLARLAEEIISIDESPSQRKPTYLATPAHVNANKFSALLGRSIIHGSVLSGRIGHRLLHPRRPTN